MWPSDPSQPADPGPQPPTSQQGEPVPADAADQGAAAPAGPPQTGVTAPPVSPEAPDATQHLTPPPFGAFGAPNPYPQAYAPQPPYAGQPFSGQPYHGQPHSGQPHNGPHPGAPYAGQPYQGQPYNAQPYQGQPYQGQPYNAQPYNGQPYQGQPYAGYAYPGAVLAPERRRTSAATKTLAWVVAAATLVLAGLGVGLATRGGSLSDIAGAGSSVQGGQSSNGTNGNGSTGNGSGSGSAGNSTNGGTSATGKATAAQAVGIVHINTTLGYQNAAAAGTGLVLTADGKILTNNHVISGATKITVTVASTGKQYAATVVGTAPTMDVAVLQLTDAKSLETVKTDDSEAVKVGDAITGVGNAGGVGGTPSASPGQVTALDQTITATDESGSGAETLHNLIETNADIQAGDSGGALYDKDSEVIGINTAASSAKQTGTQTNVTPQAYAIPINEALGIVKQIDTGKETTIIHIGYPAFLGVAVQAEGANAGAGVAAVVSGSPAATAGIAVGDVITAIDGQTVTSTTLSDVLAQLQPGDQTTITWTDSTGASHTATVTLVQGPAD